MIVALAYIGANETSAVLRHGFRRPHEDFTLTIVDRHLKSEKRSSSGVSGQANAWVKQWGKWASKCMNEGMDN